MAVLTETKTNIGRITTYLTNNVYIKLPLENVNSSIFYNFLTYEILTIVPFNSLSEIKLVSEFSDYISILAESSNSVKITDEKIGIMYIDHTASNDDDAIVFARFPYLNEINPEKRISLLQSSSLKEPHRPYWEYFRSHTNNSVKDTSLSSEHNKQSEQAPPKNLTNAKILVERGIQNYCTQNNLDRADIKDMLTFLDYIISDIFKYKLTVEEDKRLREEANNHDTMYHEIMLKLLVKMGLLE